MGSKYLPVKNSTTSFWLSPQDDFYTHRTTEILPTKSDIVIIGSGYSGASVSYYLYEDNPNPPSIVMLEARNVCSGATGRNGGHLKPDKYRSHDFYTERYNLEESASIINFEHDHLKAIKELVEKHEIDCDFVLTRACDVHLTKKAVEETITNYNSMIRNPYVKFKDDVQIDYGESAKVISKVEESSVCVTYTAAHLWPYKLVSSLLKICIEKGLNVQSNTPALKTTKLDDGRYLIETTRGKIICKKLILATNAYTASIEPRFENKIVPIKGIVSQIKSANPKIRTPYLTNSYGIRYDGADTDYLISRPDGSIIVGGAKKHIFPFKNLFYNIVDDSTLVKDTDTYFDGYMSRLFHTWKYFDAKVERMWSGILGYSDDTLPYVGEFPDEKNKYLIAGFHGHGMPRVLLCSKALAESIREEKSIQDTYIPRSFTFTQKRLANKQNFILESLDTENLFKKISKSKL